MEINISSTTPSTVTSVQDEQLLQRAVEAYRFFYPSVSLEGVFEGSRALGIEDSKQIMVLSAGPRHTVFTANSDTPYASAALDLGTLGPVVIEIPAGPFIALINDHHQRWIADLGVPGPDAGEGGRYLLLPPSFTGQLPDGYHVARSGTFVVLLALRVMPQGGDIRGALKALRDVKVYPLAKGPQAALAFIDATEKTFDATPLRWEQNLEYWKRLHGIIAKEPVFDELRTMYAALATLGITKDKPFAPDARMKSILETAAVLACDEMRVIAFASDRPERSVWPDRKWEWVALSDDANFETASFLDLEARDRWFFQAICASPAMFRRKAGAGSVYWLAARDATGAFLDGGRTYRLTIPQPVPASLFWSVTAYDPTTRSQVVTPQGKAVIGSLNDKLEPSGGAFDLTFGPTAPKEGERRWIQTTPDRGFFLYLRIYGPQTAALDGRWKLGDLERV